MTKSLPSNPNLRYLKEESKDILKAHKKANASCCAVLRNLNQFKDCPDGEILSAKVSLAEVQFALATEYGFRTWDDMRSHIPDNREIARMSRADWTTAITALVENFWTAWNDDDFERHSKDCSDAIRKQVDHTNYATQRKNMMGWMGKFKNAELIIQNEDNYSVTSVWHIYGTKKEAPGIALFSFKHINNELKFIATQICFPETKSLDPDGWRWQMKI